MKKVNALLIMLYIYFAALLAGLAAVAYYGSSLAAAAKVLVIVGAAAILASLAAVLILLVRNVRQAINIYQRQDQGLLRSAMKRIKLGAIPFFVLNFFLCLLVAFLIFGISRGFAIFVPWVWLWVMSAIIITYAITAGTSVYGILFARTLNKDGLITTGSMVKHIILQLIFVLDMVDTIFLLRDSRKPHC